MVPDASRFDAVLFDMDGVVTDTTAAHAAAWRRLFDEYLQERARRRGETFRPFDPVHDYYRYVDGKPRYDGVASFLKSRCIYLPHGSPDDNPDRETICGLGNRKNRYFAAWFEGKRVRAFPGTLRFIDTVKRAGLKVAVFSSSTNAAAVLGSAGVRGLFDAKVDGNDLLRLGIRGKPHPAMLIEAGRQVGAAPARAVVVEDAIAGVEAGIRGGFGLVIGVDRGHNRKALLRAGAHLVVRDLGELDAGQASEGKPHPARLSATPAK